MIVLETRHIQPFRLFSQISYSYDSCIQNTDASVYGFKLEPTMITRPEG